MGKSSLPPKNRTRLFILFALFTLFAVSMGSADMRPLLNNLSQKIQKPVEAVPGEINFNQTTGTTTLDSTTISNLNLTDITVSGYGYFAFSSGNVGIGTSVPSRLFEVNGESSFLGTSYISTRGLISWGGTPDGFIVRGQSGYGLYLGANGSSTTGMYVATSGNVGIGTTTPDTKLQIGDYSTISEVTFASPNSLTSGSRVRFTETSGAAMSSGFVIDHDTSDNKLHFQGWVSGTKVANILTLDRNNPLVGIGTTNPLGRLSVGTNNTVPNFFVATGGNVGIGTTNPTTKLHLADTGAVELRLSPGADGSEVDATMRLTGQSLSTSEGFALWYDNSVGDTYFDNVWSNGTDADPAIKFRTKTAGTAVNALTISHGGNIGMGTSAPLGPLSIGSNNKIPQVFVKTDGNLGIGRTNPDASLHVSTTDGFTSSFRVDDSGPGDTTPAIMVDLNGYVGFGATTLGADFQVMTEFQVGATAGSGSSYNATFNSSWVKIGPNADVNTSPTYSEAGGNLYIGSNVDNRNAIFLGGTAQANAALWGNGTNFALAPYGGKIGVGTTNITHTVTIKDSDGTTTINGAGIAGSRNPWYIVNKLSDSQIFIAYGDPSVNKFAFNSNGHAYANQNWNNGGVDYAEIFEKEDPSEKIEPGDIIVAANNSKISRASKINDPKIIGIVSTRPGFLGGNRNIAGENLLEKDMRVDFPDKFPQVALTGRVPTKLISINGVITTGDLITSSFVTGIGMKSTKTGQVIGKALESVNWSTQTCPTAKSITDINWPKDDPDNDAKPCYRVPISSFSQNVQTELISNNKLSVSNYVYIGKIITYINVSWQDPDIYLTSTGDLKISDSNSLSDKNGNLIDRIGAFAEVIVGKIQVGLLETKKLIVNGVDIIEKLNGLSKKVDQQQKEIDALKQEVNSLKGN